MIPETWRAAVSAQLGSAGWPDRVSVAITQERLPMFYSIGGMTCCHGYAPLWLHVHVDGALVASWRDAMPDPEAFARALRALAAGDVEPMHALGGGP